MISQYFGGQCSSLVSFLLSPFSQYTEVDYVFVQKLWKYPKLYLLIFSFSGLCILASCGNDSSNTDKNNKTENTNYATTSSRGDYAEWSLEGDQLSFDWQVINDAGQLRYTHDITASCGVAADTGIQPCTITGASCPDGIDACPGTLPSGAIDMMLVPGLALFALHGGQLHVGFAKDETACTADISGDYSFVHLGHGRDEVFGLYRADENFEDVQHIDYAFTHSVPLFPFPNEEETPQRVAYTTNSPTDTFVDNGCDAGLRQRALGGSELRLMATRNGLFILDFPSGEGGVLAFKSGNAASIGDFANKSFGGLSFSSDEDDPTMLEIVPFSVESSGSVLDEVGITARINGDTQNLTFIPLNGNDAGVIPAYPDFSTVATNIGMTVSASSNPLQADYRTPNDLPGFFKIDKTSGTGRNIVAAVKLNDKVIAFGSGYKFKQAPDINPATDAPYDEPGYYIVGNWIMFEK